MDKYTPEQVQAMADAIDGDGEVIVSLRAIQAMLTAYAATLRQQAARVDEAPVVDGLHRLPILWRQKEADNGEPETEFDKGYEQASQECADALEAAIAQNTQGDGEPVAESCSDHVKGETGYCTFLAPVPFGTKLYLHAERARVPDSDRIDWMEANARSVSFGKAPQQGYWVHVQGADSVYSHNESLRGAIDSARGAQAAQLAAAPFQPQDAGEVES